MHLNDLVEPLHVANSNLSRSSLRDVDLSDSELTDAKLQRLRLRDIDLSGSSISDANLSHVEISNSNLEGMSIDGIPVQELLAAYRRSAP